MSTFNFKTATAGPSNPCKATDINGGRIEKPQNFRKALLCSLAGCMCELFTELASNSTKMPEGYVYNDILCRSKHNLKGFTCRGEESQYAFRHFFDNV
eukprot:scaffold373446_cov18-Prasinocladus_malaysianus.AAC.1